MGVGVGVPVGVGVIDGVGVGGGPPPLSPLTIALKSGLLAPSSLIAQAKAPPRPWDLMNWVLTAIVWGVSPE